MSAASLEARIMMNKLESRQLKSMFGSLGMNF